VPVSGLASALRVGVGGGRSEQVNFLARLPRFRQRPARRLVQHEYAQARHYLELALRERPDDATILNNTAACSLALGDIRDAEAKARMALKRMPDSDAVKDTLGKVLQAKKSGGAEKRNRER